MNVTDGTGKVLVVGIVSTICHLRRYPLRKVAEIKRYLSNSMPFVEDIVDGFYNFIILRDDFNAPSIGNPTIFSFSCDVRIWKM